MRDKQKDDIYFLDKIKKEREHLKFYKEVIDETIAERGGDDRGVRNGYLLMAHSYDNLINLLYSAGEDMPSIIDAYEKMLAIYGTIWNMNSGYIQLIKYAVF